MARLRALTPSASPMHFFGAEVRRAREAAGMSGAELGALVPCDKATVSRVENGLTVPDEAFPIACDAAFPQMGGWFTRFYNDSQVWGEAFPPAFREFADHEKEATALRWWEHSLVPGLLQTEEYARAVLEKHPNTTSAQVDKRVAGRMARQAVLDSENPPLFWVLVDENVLYREISGPKVMHDQLWQVAEMARRPNITVQVLRRTAGGHPGLLGAFGIAQKADRRSIVYLETAADGQTVEEPGIVAEVELRFEALRTEAFTGSDSLSMIEKVADTTWKP
jgi:transcriptional regulator with XRE-family HTH domain